MRGGGGRNGEVCRTLVPSPNRLGVRTSSNGVGGDFGPARPSSCTLTSIDQRRAREAYSERQVLKGTHSGAEGSGRVVVVRGGGERGTAKSCRMRRRQTVRNKRRKQSKSST